MTEKILSDIFYDPKNKASFTSVNELYKEARRAGHIISINSVRRWLNTQSPYTLYKRVAYKFPRPPMVAYRIGEDMQIDLLDLQKFKSQNKGIRYLLTAIDVLSRKLYAEGVKNKKASTVALAFEKILSQVHVLRIFSDDGSEFKGQFEKLLKKYDIKKIIARQSVKASIIERVHRSLRSRIIKYMHHNNTIKYINVLQDIINNYNNTIHSSTGFAPNKVNARNDYKVFYNLYLKHKDIFVKRPFKFDIGDRVRLSLHKRLFTREFSKRWTLETFKISKRFRKYNINFYSVTDCAGSPILGKFYETELNNVTPETKFKVNKILEKKGDEMLVNWKNHPTDCKIWVSKNYK